MFSLKDVLYNIFSTYEKRNKDHFLPKATFLEGETEFYFFQFISAWLSTQVFKHKKHLGTWKCIWPCSLDPHLLHLFVSPDVSFRDKLYCLYPSFNTTLLMQLLLLFSYSQHIDTDFWPVNMVSYLVLQSSVLNWMKKDLHYCWGLHSLGSVIPPVLA